MNRAWRNLLSWAGIPDSSIILCIAFLFTCSDLFGQYFPAPVLMIHGGEGSAWDVNSNAATKLAGAGVVVFGATGRNENHGTLDLKSHLDGAIDLSNQIYFGKSDASIPVKSIRSVISDDHPGLEISKEVISNGPGVSWLDNMVQAQETVYGTGSFGGAFKIGALSYGAMAARIGMSHPGYFDNQRWGTTLSQSILATMLTVPAFSGHATANIINSYPALLALELLILILATIVGSLISILYAFSCVIGLGNCDSVLGDKVGASFYVAGLSALAIVYGTVTFAVATVVQGAQPGSNQLKDQEVDSALMSQLKSYSGNIAPTTQLGLLWGTSILTGARNFTVSGHQAVLDNLFSDPRVSRSIANGWFGDGDGIVFAESANATWDSRFSNANHREAIPTSHLGFDSDNIGNIIFSFFDPINSIHLEKVNSLSSYSDGIYLASDSREPIDVDGRISDYLLRQYMPIDRSQNYPLLVSPAIRIVNSGTTGGENHSSFGLENLTNFRPKDDHSEEIADFNLQDKQIYLGENLLTVEYTNAAGLKGQDQAIVRTPHIVKPQSRDGITQELAVLINGFAFASPAEKFVSYSLGYSSNSIQEIFLDESGNLNPSSFSVSFLTPDGAGPLPNSSDVKSEFYYVDAPEGAVPGPTGSERWYVRFSPSDPNNASPIAFRYSVDNGGGQVISGGPIEINRFQPIPVSNPISDDIYTSETPVYELGAPSLGTWDTSILPNGSYRLRLSVKRQEESGEVTFSPTVENVVIFGSDEYPLTSTMLTGEQQELASLITNPVNAQDPNSPGLDFKGFDGTGPGIERYEVGMIQTEFNEVPVVIPTPSPTPTFVGGPPPSMTPEPQEFNLSKENVEAFIEQSIKPLQPGVTFTNIGNVRTEAIGKITEKSVAPFEIPSLCDIDKKTIYAVFYRSVDKAGNVGPTRVLLLRYQPLSDETGPITYLHTSDPLIEPGSYLPTGARVSIVGQDPAFCGAVSGIEKTFVTVNGITEELTIHGNKTFTSKVLHLNEGRNDIEFYSVDLDGNVEPTQTRVIRIDETRPTSAGPLHGLDIAQPQCDPQQPGQEGRPLVISSDTPMTLKGADILGPQPATERSVASGVDRFYYRMRQISPVVQATQFGFVDTASTNGLEARSRSIYLPGGLTNTSQSDDGDYEITWAAFDRVGNSDLPDDFKVEESNSSGNLTQDQAFLASHTRIVTIDNTPPLVELTSPGEKNRGVCRVVNGRVTVLGSYSDLHFQDYRVEFARGQAPTESAFQLITQVAGIQVADGVLATWNTGALESDFYTLRLTGTDCVQNVSSTATTVFVGPHPAQSLLIDGHPKSVKGKPGLNHPAHVAVHNPLTHTADCGRIFVSDQNNDRIRVFASNGVSLGQIGVQGHSQGHFNHPSGLAISPSGEIFVADSNNARIQVFDLSGAFKRSFGSRGSGPGEFNMPLGISLDPDGNLWVADRNNDRVQKLDSNGAFVTQIQGLTKPEDVSVDTISGKVYVADTGANVVRRYTSSGTQDLLLADFGDGSGLFEKPQTVLANVLSYVYVADSKGRVVKFDRFGNRILKWGSHGKAAFAYNSPAGLAEDLGGNLYLADDNNMRVFRYSLPGVTVASHGCDNGAVMGTNGSDLEEPPAYLLSLGGLGSSQGRFRIPATVATDGQGNLLVLDSGNHRIQKFDAQGKSLWAKGEKGSRAGELSNPQALVVAADGNIYVADTGNNRIQVFNSHGEPVSEWGLGDSKGKNQSQPVALAIGSDGLVYVADKGLGSLAWYSTDGKQQGSWKPEGRNAPAPVALASLRGSVALALEGQPGLLRVSGGRASTWFTPQDENGQPVKIGSLSSDKTGNLYVIDSDANRLFKFGPEKLRYALGRFGAGDGEFDQPRGSVMDAEDNLWVVDSGNHRIQKFGKAPWALASGLVPGPAEALSAWPNPFSPSHGQSTVVRYVLKHDEAVKLSFRSASGQVVFAQDFRAGEPGGRQGVNEVPWNGFGYLGRVAPAGRYTVVLDEAAGAPISAALQISDTLTSSAGVASLALGSLGVSPNPALHNQPVAFGYVLSKDAQVSLTVTDKQGNVVFTKTVSAGQDGGRAGINSLIQPFAGPPGLGPYLLRVTASDGSSSVTQSLSFQVQGN